MEFQCFCTYLIKGFLGIQLESVYIVAQLINNIISLSKLSLQVLNVFFKDFFRRTSVIKQNSERKQGMQRKNRCFNNYEIRCTRASDVFSRRGVCHSFGNNSTTFGKLFVNILAKTKRI